MLDIDLNEIKYEQINKQKTSCMQGEEGWVGGWGLNGHLATKVGNT